MSNILFVRWQNIVDFLVLVTVIYWLLRWGRQTRVLRLFVGIGALVLTGSLARQLDLIVTAWVLHVAAIAAVVLLVVVYHSEIRHALAHLDPLNRLVRRMPSEPTSEGIAIAQTAFALAATKRGALMILARKDSLKNLLTGGVPLEGMISREILDAIFRKVSPVHDGAVVIEAGRISRVGVFLPLTSREDLPNHWLSRAIRCEGYRRLGRKRRGEPGGGFCNTPHGECHRFDSADAKGRHFRVISVESKDSRAFVR